MVDKIDPSIAAGVYKNAQNITQGPRISANDGPHFGDLIKKAAVDSIQTMRAGEKTSDVVEAVTAAELTLQTVVALRDRLLNAYQEIMRLPI